jgi:uncharacterized protein YkwD
MSEKIGLFLSGLALGVLISVFALAVAVQKGVFLPQEVQQSNNASESAIIPGETKLVQKGSPPPTPTPVPKPEYYSGPQLWEAVNKSRVEHGVNPLKQLDLLCTIAAIRLNQQLELGTLDNHARFEETVKSVQGASKYNVAEFLIKGPTTAQGAVDAWLNTMGHSKLMTAGEYIYGCTYAQDGFGVAIAAY